MKDLKTENEKIKQTYKSIIHDIVDLIRKKKIEVDEISESLFITTEELLDALINPKEDLSFYIILLNLVESY